MAHASNVMETTVEIAGVHGFTRDKALNFFLECYQAAYRNELDAFVNERAERSLAPTVKTG